MIRARVVAAGRAFLSASIRIGLAGLVVAAVGACGPEGGPGPGGDAVDGPDGVGDPGAPAADVALDEGGDDDSKWAGHPLLADRLLRIAHRGGGRRAPENTLAAFEHAASVGVDVLETDVHATADGVVVCMHDADVGRTTDGEGPLKGYTAEALAGLDAGYRYTGDGGATFPFRGTGVRVPRLAELLAAFPEHPWSVEIKQREPPIVDAVLAVIDAADASDRVLLVSRFDDVIAAVRAARPDVVTAMGIAEMVELSLLDEEAEKSWSPPAPAVQLPFAGIDAESLARAHRLGLKVQAWTVNDADDMAALAALGVDGIMSDDPDLLVATVP